MVLASQIAWSESCEYALQTISTSSNQNDLEPVLKVLRVVEATLNILADSVLQEQPPVRRRKLEHLVSKLLLIRCIFLLLFFCSSIKLCFSYRRILEFCEEVRLMCNLIVKFFHSQRLPKSKFKKISKSYL